MILSFSEDKFKERILSGVKTHTIRTDRTERWKKGQVIHFWRGNPRNTKATPKPHQFHECNCRSVQSFEMTFELDIHNIEVKIDNRFISDNEILELAIADGFDSIEDMTNWFFGQLDGKNCFKGRLIHWTKKVY
jgi:hypothetical protein